MFEPQRMLLSRLLEDLLPRLEDRSSSAAWAQAKSALQACVEPEPDIAPVLEARNYAALADLIGEWKAGRRPFPLHDRELLKGAMTTFRKSLKVKRLDAESSIGGGPMSGGRKSAIAGIVPPFRFADDVWQELARQKRLIALRNGTYTLPPESA
ncbi:MAG: hypothetical protein IPN34_13410 [Planctomycetes bacterium]|nr:hypothetical protein [Planctomycetota bacterium]